MDYKLLCKTVDTAAWWGAEMAEALLVQVVSLGIGGIAFDKAAQGVRRRMLGSAEKFKSEMVL